MREKTRSGVIRWLCLLTLLLQAASAGAEQPLRTWKSADGKYSIKASFVEIDEEQALLKRENGKVIKVPIAKLSPADQHYANRQQKLIVKERGEAAATPPAEVPKSAAASTPDAGATSADSETSEEPGPDEERPIKARTKPTISQLPGADAPVHKVSAKQFAADTEQADKGAAKYQGSWVEVTGILNGIQVIGDADYGYVVTSSLSETEDFHFDDLVRVWFAAGEHPWEQAAEKETVTIRGAFAVMSNVGKLVESSVIKPSKTVMLNVTVDELAKQFTANPEAFVKAHNFKQAVVTGKFAGHIAPPETEDAKPEEWIALDGVSGRRYYAFAGSGAREFRGLRPGQPIAVLGILFGISAEDSLDKIYLQSSQNLTPFMPAAKQEPAVTRRVRKRPGTKRG